MAVTGKQRSAVKAKLASLCSVILCAAMIFGIIVVFRTDVGAASGPLLYYNDRAWTKARLPLESVNNLWYVPIRLYAQLFPDVEVQYNNGFNLFIIQNGDKYLSFIMDSDYAYNEDLTTIYILPYKLHDEYSVPAETVCRYLGLGYETLTSPYTGETAVRVTNGSEKLTIEELVARKYPGFFEPVTSGTTAPPVTMPPTDTTKKPVDTEDTEPAPELGERTIYLTIEDSPGEYTDEILDTLAKYGYKATFFVVGDYAAAKPETLSRILAEGHEIALHTMSHDQKALDGAEAILGDIEAENELLYGLVRRKSHIWRAPEGSGGMRQLDRAVEVELNLRGYLVWDFNIDAGTGDVRKAVRKVIDGIWETGVPVIRIRESESAAAILDGVLSFISENSDACEVRTITPAFHEYNDIY